MTTDEYIQLEILLGKLKTELGKRFCIVPNNVHDGYFIGLYADNEGNLIDNAADATIEKTVQKLLSKNSLSVV